MGIKLDWEVEAEGDWEEVVEDPAAAAARETERRRWLMRFVALLIVAGLIVGAALYRVRQLAAERRAQLEAAVAAETTALRIGDRASFLDVQVDIDLWQQTQSVVFDQYQRGIIATGEILDLQIDLDQAWVVLREEINVGSYHVSWFYQRTDDGWRHVPPDLGQWSQQTVASSRIFDMTYRQVDQPLVDALAPLLDSWWAGAEVLTGYSGTVERPSVRFSSDPVVHWLPADDSTLLIPSSLVQRLPADGSLNPIIAGQVADAVAGHWAQLVTLSDQPDPAGDRQWLEEEIARWLRYELAPDLPVATEQTTQSLPPTPAPVLSPLVEFYGLDMIPDLLATARRTGQPARALEVVTGDPLQSLPVDWSGYIEQRLLAEQTMLNQGGVREVDQIFRDTIVERRNEGIVPDPLTLMTAAPGAITVTDIQWVGDILLAKVESKVPNHAFGPPGHYLTYEPFRVDDGGWWHTRVILADWGEIVTEDSDHFVLRYYDLDGIYADGLLIALEDAYEQLTADYGRSPDQPEPIVVYVTPTLIDDQLWGGEYADTSHSITTLSPYVRGLPADIDPSLVVKADLYYQLAELLVDQQSGTIAIDHPLPQAFIRWGVGRVDSQAATVYPPPDVPVAAGPNDIRALWPDRLVRQAGVQRSYYAELTATQLLIDKLLTLYGPEVAPALLVSLATSETLDQWLAPFGISVDDLYLP